MMTESIRLFITGLLLLVGIPLLATPTGLIWIPSTDIQPYKVWHIDSDALIYTNGGATGAFTEQGVLYGFTPHFEAGMDVAETFFNAHTTPSAPIWFNGKYRLVTPIDINSFALVVGAYDVSLQPSANAQIFYLEGAETFGSIRVTAGGYEGRKSVLGNANTGLLLGFDYPNHKWWYAIDYQSGRNPYGTWNIGVGYHFTDKLEMIVGYDRYIAPAIVGAKSSFNFQVDIDI